MKAFKYLLPVLGGIPYLFALPYMYFAWRSSPMDRWDWIFPILFLLAVAVFCIRNRSKGPAAPFHWTLVLPLLVSIGIMSGGMTASVHAIYILGSIAFAWSCCLLAFRHAAAGVLIPAFFVLALGCTSMTYWIGFFLGLQGKDVFILKLLLAVGAISLSFWKIRFKLESLGFMSVVLIAFFLCWQTGTLSRTSVPLLPDFGNSAFPAMYLCRELPASESAERFFRNSSIRYFNIADDERSYHVLAVRCGNDIHEIHPASHCLRSSGLQIVSEVEVNYRIHGKSVRITEIVVQGKYRKELYAVWYSCDAFSVGNFLSFRGRWSQDTVWHTYQISTDITDNPSSARQGIEQLLNRMPEFREMHQTKGMLER